jgi:hypothetical protein
MTRSDSGGIRNYSSIQLGTNTSLQDNYKQTNLLVEKWEVEERRKISSKLNLWTMSENFWSTGQSRVDITNHSIEYGYWKDPRDSFFERLKIEKEIEEHDDVMDWTDEFEAANF